MNPTSRALGAMFALLVLGFATGCQSLIIPAKTQDSAASVPKVLSEDDQYVYLEPETGSYLPTKMKKSEYEKMVKASKVETISGEQFQREVNSAQRASRQGG